MPRRHIITGPLPPFWLSEERFPLWQWESVFKSELWPKEGSEWKVQEHYWEANDPHDIDDQWEDTMIEIRCVVSAGDLLELEITRTESSEFGLDSKEEYRVTVTRGKRGERDQVQVETGGEMVSVDSIRPIWDVMQKAGRLV